jgi:hypothetical protein
VGYSGFMLVLGCVLPCLGLGLFIYLFKLYLENRDDWSDGPEFVRDINKKLHLHNVETERDLL